MVVKSKNDEHQSEQGNLFLFTNTYEAPFLGEGGELQHDRLGTPYKRSAARPSRLKIFETLAKSMFAPNKHFRALETFDDN